MDAAVINSNTKDVARACSVNRGIVRWLDLNGFTGTAAALIQRREVD